MNKKTTFNYDKKLNLQRFKQEKGITLIALIITVIVLLILAGTAISSIINDGVLSYTKNALVKYEEAEKNEQEMLNQLENSLIDGDTSDHLGSHTWNYVNKYTQSQFDLLTEHGSGDYTAFCEECDKVCTHPRGITWSVSQINSATYKGSHYIIYNCSICGEHEILQACTEYGRCTICAKNLSYELLNNSN